MELGGLEPPTSWVRSRRSGRYISARSGRLAGSFGYSTGRVLGADGRRWPPIAVESGTLGDECLDGRGGLVELCDVARGPHAGALSQSGVRVTGVIPVPSARIT